jgi:hypothetical protein
MIKLIVTDVDDTIIQEGSRNLNPDYFEMVRKFREKGVIFVVASGRQKPSIKKTFTEVQDELIYLADNGTDIQAPDFITSMKFDKEDYIQLVADINALSDEYQIMACRPDCAFIEEKNEEYYNRMLHNYGFILEKVQDAALLDGICKVSMYRKDGIEPHIEEKMQRLWSDKMDVCIAGGQFLDFMSKNCNKGSAVRVIQEHYGIKPEETVVFGNADNDISMLKQAKYSYAVANGSEGVKAAALEVIGAMQEDAVLQKMKEIYEMI